jgi:hypothetical protein
MASVSTVDNNAVVSLTYTCRILTMKPNLRFKARHTYSVPSSPLESKQ